MILSPMILLGPCYKPSETAPINLQRSNLSHAAPLSFHGTALSRAIITSNDSIVSRSSNYRVRGCQLRACHGGDEDQIMSQDGPRDGACRICLRPRSKTTGTNIECCNTIESSSRSPMEGRSSLRKQDMDRRRRANQGGELIALNNTECTKQSIYDVLTLNQPFWSKVSSDPLVRLAHRNHSRSFEVSYSPNSRLLAKLNDWKVNHSRKNGVITTAPRVRPACST